jgi:hypothetical protein
MIYVSDKALYRSSPYTNVDKANTLFNIVSSPTDVDDSVVANIVFKYRDVKH